MATKEQIRPILSELQGYLAQAPDNNEHLEEEVVIHVNEAIQRLGTILRNEPLGPYFVSPIRAGVDENGDNYSYYSSQVYSTKLAGLIAHLQAKYFFDEKATSSAAPSTSIHVNQQQSVSVQIEIAIEMTELITKKLNEVTDPKEKSFLEKIKGTLRTAKSIPELIALVITTAQAYGITIDQLKNLFC